MIELWTFLLNASAAVQVQFLKEFCHMSYTEEEAPSIIRKIIEEKDSEKK